MDRDLGRIFDQSVRSYQGGDLAEAGRLARIVLAAEPSHASSLHLLGLIAVKDGRFEAAAELIGRVVEQNHGDPLASYNLGTALAALGRIEEAGEQFRNSLALNPDSAAAHVNLGFILNRQGRLDAAVVQYELALAIERDSVVAHNNLGNVLVDLGRIDEALVHYWRALSLNSEDANTHNHLGVALVEKGMIADAMEHYRRALALDPQHANAHSNLGIVLRDQDRADEAIAHFRMALAADSRHAPAHNNLGIALKDKGSFSEALAHFESAIKARPDYAEAHFNRAEIKSFHRGDADLAALEALAGGTEVPPAKAAYIHFALAKAYEDIADFPRAFEQLQAGNARKRQEIDYDEPEVLGMFGRITRAFDSAWFDRLRGVGEPSAVPIFVLGMPRSGSTLIEQILASHPHVHGAGELPIMGAIANRLCVGVPPAHYPEGVRSLQEADLGRLGQAYLERLPPLPEGKIRIVDKAPLNFLHLGLIRLALPNARIIHIRRNVLDTCVSCYSKLFSSGLLFAYDLRELARYYRCYLRLMAHWRSVVPTGVLEVSYEAVVNDLDGQSRRLLDFCGLPWDPRCIDFHATRRTVKTASVAQVRRPLYRSALERWRAYEFGLAPLREELGDIIAEDGTAVGQ